MYWYLFISVFSIMLASLAGKLFTWKALGVYILPRIRYLIALAAGVFVVIIYGLVEETLHEGLSTEIVLAFVVGAILLETITRLLPKETHHHHGPHPEHTHSTIDARRMLIGDAVHNIHDGIALVPAFLVSPVVGIGTALGVLLHELVQEVSEFFVLKEAGYSDRKALAWNFAVSSTIVIGVVLASLLASVEAFAHPLVAFSAGGFTYVLFRDLLPSIISHARVEKCPGKYVLMFLVGLGIMLTVSLTVPHEHEEELPLPEGFGLA
jgi:zinc and cadmium transporter